MDATLTILDLVIAGALTVARAQALRDQIQAMRAEGRDPSPEEWAALFAQIEADSAALDAAAKG